MSENPRQKVPISSIPLSLDDQYLNKKLFHTYAADIDHDGEADGSERSVSLMD